MNPTTIEIAAQLAAPALEEKAMPGAVLRCAQGFTKRANSLNLLSTAHGDSQELTSACERFFTQRALPSVVRIPSFTQAQKLDIHLQKQDYQVVDTTDVMTNNFNHHLADYEAVVELELNTWLQHFYAIKGNNTRLNLHQQLLNKVNQQTIACAIFNPQGLAVACGLAVISHGLVGLYNIETHPHYRQQGYGLQLVSSLLARAKRNGAMGAYLQVVKTNTGAKQLYKKIGFSSAYHYWYRIKNLHCTHKDFHHEYH